MGAADPGHRDALHRPAAGQHRPRRDRQPAPPPAGLTNRHSILLAALLALAATAGRAEAHANLVRSQPAAGAVLEAAPGELRLWFSEQPEVGYSEVRLFDRSGQPVGRLGAARAGAEPGLLVVPLEAPPPGVYTVAWRALSAVDGHVTAGAFAFALGADQVPPEGLRPAALSAGAASAPQPLAVAARWLTYLSLALLVAPLFRWSAPALRVPDGRLSPSGRPSSPAHPLGAIAWTIALLAAALAAVAQAT
ncbi:MAG TPA: copper resistance CopC family protein, partial [Chloroflexota bacterium]